MLATYPRVNPTSISFKPAYVRERHLGPVTIPQARQAVFKTAELMRQTVARAGKGQ